MTTSRWISRRNFMQTSAMAALGARQLLAAAPADLLEPSRLAFVGAIGPEQGVHVFAMERSSWKHLHFVSTEAPVSLALHPSGNTLYVLNEINEYRGLPLGTVETYRLHRKTGELTSLGRQPLALSATLPRQMAVSPDGRTLAVAVHGGGAYNLLPIHKDGSLGRVHSTLKETGCGPIAQHQRAAHPQTVAFDLAGTRLIAADLGSDRLSVFSLSKSDAALAVHSRLQLPSGSGPRHITLHPEGTFLYVDHALAGSASGFRYDPDTGAIGEQCASVSGAFGDALVLHPGGAIAYSARGAELASWRIDRSTKALQPMQNISLENETVRAMLPLPDGSAVIALTGNSVLRIDIDVASGRLGNIASVAGIAEARSITML